MKRTMRTLAAAAGIIFFFTGIASSSDKSVIVGFHKKPGLAEKALIHGAKGVIKHTYRHISAVSARLSDEAIADLKNNENIAYVEDDGFFAAVEPALSGEYAGAWGVQHIGSDIAYTSGNKGTGVRVAVIDTGIDYTHEDLDDNYRGGYDFVFLDDDPFDDSWNSHGTHVAGVIAAEDNGIGVIGVAPEVELYAVKVLDGGGFGLLSWILEGLEWAVDHQMDIANLSLQGRDFQSLHDACDAAYAAGVIVVSAGGNTYGGSVSYPASYDSVIAVTGTDAYDMKAYFSPVGPELDLAAPGIDILSTVAGGGYALLSGTSQAAPHVSGTAALFFTSDLQDVTGDGIINHKDVREMLRITALDLGAQGEDPVFGAGLVNAAEAALPAEPQIITITRTHGFPKNDAQTVSLSGAVYEITLENNDLKGVIVDVFETGVHQTDLSTKYHFKDKPHFNNTISSTHVRQKDAVFLIDAAGTDYEVMFTPIGKPGNSLNIIINMQGEGK